MPDQPVIATPSIDRALGSFSAVSSGLRLLSMGPPLILVVLGAVISLLTPNFLTVGNLVNILDALVKAIRGEKVESLIDSGAALVTKVNMAQFK